MFPFSNIMALECLSSQPVNYERDISALYLLRNVQGMQGREKSVLVIFRLLHNAKGTVSYIYLTVSVPLANLNDRASHQGKIKVDQSSSLIT